MREVTFSEFEEMFDTLIGAAEQGETFAIMRDGKQAALLVPPSIKKDTTSDPVIYD